MKRKRCWNSLWLLAMVFVLLLPVVVPAAEKAETGRHVVVTQTYVDPLFEDEISESELKEVLHNSIKNRKTAAKRCTSEKEAAVAMRAFLVKRQAEFTIPVKLKVEKVSGTQDRYKKLDEVMKRIRDIAFQETDKSYEGDYMHQMKAFICEGLGNFNGDYFEGSLYYYVPLMSTAAQEKEANAAVARIMGELPLKGKSEYEKVRIIYDYICSHTTYDNEESGPSDIPYTGYSVLVRGKGTCDGFSKAVYRLMREAGIGCRCISGYPKNKNIGHAWNIVRIGKSWYYVDATWDQGNYAQKYSYRYFLKGSKDRSFADHEGFIIQLPAAEPDFWKKHPLSADDYPYKDPEPTVTPVPGGDDVPGIPQVPDIKMGADSLTLSWDTEANAVSYDVLRSVNGGEIRTIATTSKTTYTDQKIKSGNEYCYYLVANGKNSYKSERSACHNFYFLTPPKNLKVRAIKNRSASLTWKKVRGAGGYQIRYSLNKNMKSSKKINIKKASTLRKVIRNLKKKKYYFQIRSWRAFPGYKVYSTWSKTVGRKIS